MNISSVNQSTGYKPDKNVSSESLSGRESVVSQIKTVDALQQAELQGEKVTIGDMQVVRTIDRVLKAIQGPDTTFDMSVHEQTKTIVIKVLNKETGELIREIPPEKTLDLVAKFMEINGILIDKRV
ncbi:flagellar protein FlaG [Paenibacillus sp. Leaf72]|uniref:flagellar protein FlaG n=1 Tax=Paenibacillus sp. Leaf72 TaxID=1736234 RepID=UPI0007C7F251|nr:flagellar protein FlaG [Paenibacillus sp. Leaf72]